jgi:hypothetical protein
MQKITRADYLDSSKPEATHRAYYAQFVTDEIRQRLLRHIGREEIISSTDPHFNDIALRRWDALTRYAAYPIDRYVPYPGVVPSNVREMLLETDPNIGSGQSAMLYIYKEAAQQIREEA